jgi:plastocyanin
MHRTLRTLALLVPLCQLVACSDSASPVDAPRVSMQDQCDRASFDAALGTGSCMTNGSVTFAQFNSELAASRHVAAWQFVPATLTVRVGQTITAVNDGGEVHTFTRVEQFGGGIVPALNTGSGNPVETPECAELQATDLVSAGAAVATQPATASGTVRYQCCIHPWMRTVVTVN